MPSENGLGNFPTTRALTLPAPPSAVWAAQKIAAAKRVPLVAMRSSRMMMIAIADQIKAVIAARSPRQVIQMVVGRIVVQMSALQAFWARTDEGLKNEAVDVSTEVGRVKDHSKVAVIVWNGREDAPFKADGAVSSVRHGSINGTNFAGAADFVVIEAHNGFPHVTHSMVRGGH